jgi:hypothetical protein
MAAAVTAIKDTIPDISTLAQEQQAVQQQLLMLLRHTSLP